MAFLHDSAPEGLLVLMQGSIGHVYGVSRVVCHGISEYHDLPDPWSEQRHCLQHLMDYACNALASRTQMIPPATLLSIAHGSRCAASCRREGDQKRRGEMTTSYSG